MSDLKISIHGRNDNTIITEKVFPQPQDERMRIFAMGGRNASRSVRIIFEPSAVERLFTEIRWGRQCMQGDMEQAGILIGNYYRDNSSPEEIIWGDVMAVIPADPALVTASFEAIEIGPSAWKKMYEDAEAYRTENLQILGWYHTHLAHINTRFSGVDIRTQSIAFTYPYSFGAVFNPNQRRWSVFYGPDSRECVGELLIDEANNSRFRRPAITIKQVNGDQELPPAGAIDAADMQTDPYAQQEQQGQAEENPGVLSPVQLAGQFFSGMGKWLLKPKDRSEETEYVPERPRRPHPEQEISRENPLETSLSPPLIHTAYPKPHQARQAEVPKITIRQHSTQDPRVTAAPYRTPGEYSAAMRITTMYYNLYPGNKIYKADKNYWFNSKSVYDTIQQIQRDPTYRTASGIPPIQANLNLVKETEMYLSLQSIAPNAVLVVLNNEADRNLLSRDSIDQIRVISQRNANQNASANHIIIINMLDNGDLNVVVVKIEKNP